MSDPEFSELDWRYRPDQKPLDGGLIWLERPVQVKQDSVVDWLEPQMTSMVQAISFGSTRILAFDPKDGYARVTPDLDSVAHSGTALGLVAYLTEYGETSSPGLLLPLVMEAWMVDETIDDRNIRMIEMHPDRSDYLLNVWVAHFCAKLFGYMNQRLVRTESVTTENKAQLRDLRRQNYNGSVQVVHWRKEVMRPDVEQAAREGAEIDWSCHWRVKQHVRHYKNGRTVTIKPYLKGNFDKPFKQPNTIVNVVDR